MLPWYHASQHLQQGHLNCSLGLWNLEMSQQLFYEEFLNATQFPSKSLLCYALTVKVISPNKSQQISRLMIIYLVAQPYKINVVTNSNRKVKCILKKQVTQNYIFDYSYLGYYNVCQSKSLHSTTDTKYSNFLKVFQLIEMLQTQDKQNTMQNECGSQNPKSGSSKALSLHAQCGKLRISLEVSKGYKFWISTL